MRLAASCVSGWCRLLLGDGCYKPHGEARKGELVGGSAGSGQGGELRSQEYMDVV